jgi:uncharacterized protein (DUF58 family)
LPELKGLKPSSEGRAPLFPRLRLSPSGFLILLFIAAAFTAGNVRQELALTLLGAVFLSVWMYCLILGLVIALIHRKGAYTLSVRLTPRSITVGNTVETLCRESPRFLRLPGILVRYRVRLETRDGRRVEQIFDPDTPVAPLGIPLRGAYYPVRDELLIFDAFNIFDFAWPLPRGAEARILAGPRAAEEPLPVNPRAGGREQRAGPHYKRTDDLIDHRPYIPGDDPRRINWKLYSHGPFNSLFVREGETEPPPHSQLLILADTEADPRLYSLEAGRAAVDQLCEQALAIALAFTGRGMDVLIGYTGGPLTGGDGEELAEAMAGPSVIMRAPSTGRGKGRPLDNTFSAELPIAGRGTCILALPRTTGGTGATALDRFLTRRAGGAVFAPAAGPSNATAGLGGGDGNDSPAAPGTSGGPQSSAPCEIIFIYPDDGVPRVSAAQRQEGLAGSKTARGKAAAIRETAETCARLYDSRAGVRALAMAATGQRAGGEAP